MELKILWTDFAKAELRKVFEYLMENASYRVAKNEIQKIVFETLRLKKQPEIGQITKIKKQIKRAVYSAFRQIV